MPPSNSDTDRSSAADVVAEIGREVTRTFPLVVSAIPTLFTDSTGEPAVRFDLTLRDPPAGRELGLADVDPIERQIRGLAADVGVYVYFRVRTESEARDIAAGTYYG